VLVVWCPDWPVVVTGEDPAAPAAVVATGHVVACSAAARAAGVRRGQRLRDAQRHCPVLIVHARDVDAEARAFESVVTTVEAFCPRVEVVRPGMCAIGARGPARYFGGEKALVEKISHAMADRGFACRVGVADGMFAAQLAARASPAGVVVRPGETPRFLAPHPAGMLGHPELAHLLARLGIHTIGEFAALPAEDVLARFGNEGVTAHRLARGLEPRPLAPRPASDDLSAAMEFDPPAVTAEPVVFAGKALADRMHANLTGYGLMCVRVEVQVGFEGRQMYSRLWRHDGLLSSLAVAERVRWQLDGWRTGASSARPQPEGVPGRHVEGENAASRDASPCLPGAPPARRGPDRGSQTGSDIPDIPDIPRGGISMLRLVPDQMVPDQGRQLGLWGGALVSDRAARAAARVQSMLGHEAVTRPMLTGGRSPGDQVMLVPFGDSGVPSLPADRPWPGCIPAPSPATVYPAPLPANVTCASGELVTVTGRAAISAPPAQLIIVDGPPLEITAWAGPWPVCELWWDPARERRLARFQLVTGDGTAWLAAVEDGRWIIEASYD